LIDVQKIYLFMSQKEKLFHSFGDEWASIGEVASRFLEVSKVGRGGDRLAPT